MLRQGGKYVTLRLHNMQSSTNTDNVTLRCDELGRVDEGFGRKQRGVVDPSEDDGDGVELQGVVGLLCNVVCADRVLETDVESDENN